jgi:class 3 adenylate cyclase
MAEEGFRRKLTTILSTDAVDFSRLMGEDEEATVRTSEADPEVLNTFIQEHNGQVLDVPGDNLRTIKAQRRSGWRVLSGCTRFQGSRPCSGGLFGPGLSKTYGSKPQLSPRC